MNTTFSASTATVRRPSQRREDMLRPIVLHQGYTCYAPGSVLVEYGRTKVLCTANITAGVPRFIKDRAALQGWVTAEYSMLPGATQERTAREATRGKQSPRTQEIQRLIGRSLRSMVDLTQLGEYTITLDCDVLQADGGTRTAAITGACLALVDAITEYMKKKKIKRPPLRYLIAAVSVGIYQGCPVLDLDYAEDQHAHTDMNLVMSETGHWIEIQGTAEQTPFTDDELHAMLRLGQTGIRALLTQLQAHIPDQRAFIALA